MFWYCHSNLSWPQRPLGCQTIPIWGEKGQKTRCEHTRQTAADDLQAVNEPRELSSLYTKHDVN
eukprot:5256525-Pleurochrysis_carterae.AAC.1